MKTDLDFELTFEGANLVDGSIDARDLAPSLLALSEAIDEAREQVAVDSRPAALRVRPNFEKGSFRVFLEMGQSYYAQFVDLFSGNHVQAWATLFSLLGLSGAGLLQFIKKSKGKKPIRVLEIEETRRVKVVFEDFRCVVRTTQVIEDDGIKSHHEILRVIRKEVIPAQDGIDFDAKG